jgi:hypothetical protein
LVSGYRLAYLVAAAIVACAVLVTLFFLRAARRASAVPVAVTLTPWR